MDPREYVDGLIHLVELGYVEWHANESAFAMLLPGLGDTGGRVQIYVPTAEELDAMVDDLNASA